jgi:Fe-S-cluster containining protein
MTPVPCNGCRACCKNQAVCLFPEDEPNFDVFELRTVTVDGALLTMLKLKPNGECWHLGSNGCTIYDRRPVMCKAYDCRKQFLATAKRDRRALGTPEIWEAARQRLDTLDVDERAKALHRRK